MYQFIKKFFCYSHFETLKNVNDRVKPAEMMKIMRDFERENAKTDMKEKLSKFYLLINVL